MAKIFLPSLDCRTKALCKNIGKDFPAILGLTNGKDFPAILGLSKALRGNFGKDFPAILDWRTKALCGNIGKDFPAILGLTNKSSTWELWQRFSPSLDWWTKALRGNFGKDFPAILGLTNKSSTWELWQRFSCHPWTDEQKLYVGTLAKIFLPSLDWRTKALRSKALRGNWQRFSCHPWTDEQKLYIGFCGNIGKDFPAILGLSNGKDFPAILGLSNKSSMWELWQRFSCHPWTDKQKLYVGTLAKIFLPSLDWRTKALRGNFGKDFPAILGLTNALNFGKDFPLLGLTNKSWELWQRFSCHPWTDEQKLYVGTLAKIFLPSLDWRTKALRGNFGKDFPAILGLTNKSSTWELWQRFSCHPWKQKLYVETLFFWNFGKDFGKDAILGLTNKSSTWELWQRFSCHPWTDEQKLYINFGKDFPAILGLTNKSSMWKHWQRFSYFGKDFPAILGLTNKSSTWELWQRFSCHPWTDEQKLYVELWQRFSCHP